MFKNILLIILIFWAWKSQPADNFDQKVMDKRIESREFLRHFKTCKDLCSASSSRNSFLYLYLDKDFYKNENGDVFAEYKRNHAVVGDQYYYFFDGGGITISAEPLFQKRKKVERPTVKEAFEREIGQKEYIAEGIRHGFLMPLLNEEQLSSFIDKKEYSKRLISKKMKDLENKDKFDYVKIEDYAAREAAKELFLEFSKEQRDRFRGQKASNGFYYIEIEGGVIFAEKDIFNKRLRQRAEFYYLPGDLFVNRAHRFSTVLYKDKGYKLKFLNEIEERDKKGIDFLKRSKNDCEGLRTPGDFTEKAKKVGVLITSDKECDLGWEWEDIKDETAPIKFKAKTTNNFGIYNIYPWVDDDLYVVSTSGDALSIISAPNFEDVKNDASTLKKDLKLRRDGREIDIIGYFY